MPTNNTLRVVIEDTVYAWSLSGSTFDRLVDDLYDAMLETYGPPF